MIAAVPTVPLLSELTAYAEHEPALDRRLWARPLVPEHDTDLLWPWMQRPPVAEFWAMAWPRNWIGDYLRARSTTTRAAPTWASSTSCRSAIWRSTTRSATSWALTPPCCRATSVRTC